MLEANSQPGQLADGPWSPAWCYSNSVYWIGLQRTRAVSTAAPFSACKWTGSWNLVSPWRNLPKPCVFTACAQRLAVVSERYVCTLNMVEARAFLIPQGFPGICRSWRSCDQVEQHSCTLTKGRNFFCQNDRHSFLEPGPLVPMVRGAHYISVNGTVTISI